MTPKKAARPRASLYVRLSRQAAAENLSVDGMTADLRAVAAREGFVEIALHVDDGRSGAMRDRPQFLEWLDDGRAGRADVLLAWHVDRMTREGINVAALLLDIVEGKDPTTGRVVNRPVRLMDATGLDSDDGESFRWRFVIAAEVARAERERMRARNKAASLRLRTAGRWAGGTAPFGYRAATRKDGGAGKTLVLEPVEADAIREAAARVLAGEPLGRVTRWMNHHGPAPRRAPQWSRVALRQVLTGDAILGRVSVNGEPLRDSTGKASTPFEPIVTVAESLALREALKPVPDARKGGRKPARLLSGLLVCHACGARLQVARRTSGDVTYRCQNRADGGLCERPVAVSAPAVEAYVADRFLEAWGDAPVIEERAVVEDDGDLAEIEDAIAATVREMATAATPELFARLQALQVDREQAADRARYTSHRTVYVPAGFTFGDTWRNSPDVDDRRDLLSAAIGRVEIRPGRRGPRGIDPERVGIEWKTRATVEELIAELGADALAAFVDQLPAGVRDRLRAASS